MIGFITGTILQITSTGIIIDVHGIGYDVTTTSKESTNVTIGQELSMNIYTAVKEDSITLYGFNQNKDKELFKKLISVSGIGPKTALSIVEAYTAEEISSMLIEGDVTKLTKIPGIGKKSAQRLILELENQLVKDSSQKSDPSANFEGLRTALTQFGYSVTEIDSVLDEIDASLPIEKQLKSALQLLS